MTKGLRAWTNKLRKQEMPVPSEVIVELNTITGDDDADVNQLAEVILRDPNLTSQVLRIANSVLYNYSNTPINTVSRAIVLIGLKGVRAICISLLVLESLIGERPRARVLELIARAFHAATQARALARAVEDRGAEEAFIAGLLFNLGEMAFWACEDVPLDHPGLLSSNQRERRVAMEDVLGTSFKAITRELAVHWKLGNTLETALYPSGETSARVQAVIIGERISRAADYGWRSPQMKKVLREVMSFTEKDATQALTMVKQAADYAAEVALNYGVAEACPLIPSSSGKSKPRVTSQSDVLRGDPAVQLNILRELSAAASERIDVNTLFQMVLEGMHRGIGLERVIFAFIDQHKLKGRYVLGKGTDQWRNNFLMDIGPLCDNLFARAVSAGGCHWCTKSEIAKNSQLYDMEMSRVIGKFPSFIAVIQLDARKIGVFYADRWNFGGELSEDQFESFKHFATQTQVCLGLFRQGGAGR